MFTVNIKRGLYTASLAGVAISLPLSEWLLSAFMILLFIAWLLSGGIRFLYSQARNEKTVFIFLLSYLVYLIWMINTSDSTFGIAELRLKLPLIVFPLVIAFSHPPDKKEQKIIISVFIAGVVISSAAGIINGHSHLFSGYPDPKSLSPFISHIRLALMAVFAIACSGWYFLYRREGRLTDWFFPVAALWLTIYLFFLLSLTGIILFLFTLAFSSVLLAVRSQKRIIRFIIPASLAVILIAIVAVALQSVISFYRPGTAYSYPLATHTPGGNSYFHDEGKKDTENGNLVWIYICSDELRSGWNRKSTVPYDGYDKKGQMLRYTLIRYMTSAGLTKDSSGVSMLTKDDIASVENGITNRYFILWSPWRTKLYELIWQVDYFRRGGNPSGHSVTQRLVYFKTGFEIFLKHPLFGTGTGDLPMEYRLQYETDKTNLDQDYRLLSHNQFLNFLVSFGLTGTLIIIYSFFFPFFAKGGHKRFLPAVFFLLVLLSMLWEDTLETHTGVSFFAYFYSVFIFGSNGNEEDNKKI